MNGLGMQWNGLAGAHVEPRGRRGAHVELLWSYRGARVELAQANYTKRERKNGKNRPKPGNFDCQRRVTRLATFARRKAIKGSFCMNQFIQYNFCHAFDVFYHIVIPEADDTIAFGFEKGCPFIIIFFQFQMLTQ